MPLTPQIQFGREHLELPLGTTVGPNWLGIYAGTAPCSFRSRDEREWTRDWVTLQVGRTFSPHEFKHALATVSLAQNWTRTDACLSKREWLFEGVGQNFSGSVIML
jgi:hypothetical protein